MIFHDGRGPEDQRGLDTSSVPTLSDITDFYQSVFLQFIISLIYVKPLIKITRGAFVSHANNWRPLLSLYLALASKVWGDLSMWNMDFSKIVLSGVHFIAGAHKQAGAGTDKSPRV